MTIDAEDGFWIAIRGRGKILHFDNIGAKIEEIDVPVPHPTSCCFGGKDMNTLFITSSKIALSAVEQKKYPLAGRIFKLKTDVFGKHETKYKG